MIASGFGPAPQDVREVLDVVGDQDPALMAGNLEQVLVVEALEFWVLVEGKDIVAALPETAADGAPRDVCVQK